ncbi:cyclase family protein [Curtobacterium sp. 22159]|uniref:cyclase family protein n=1 Tax=Curtobacterium sp. 22159 TaxID=3453882 RepID=UPI003F84AFF0
MQEHRAVFDVQISFVNGGGLSAEGFRLDVPRPDVSEAETARLLVRHLGLALVGDVRFERFEIVAEPHKGSRGMGSERPQATMDDHRLVDLSRPIDEWVAGPLGTTFVAGEDGRGVASVGIDGVVDLPAEVFRLTDVVEPGIPASVFHDRDVRGKAVLLQTAQDHHDGSPVPERTPPFLRRDAAEHLASAGVTLVGIDSAGVDGASAEAGNGRPARSLLLAAGIHVVEDLTGLEALPTSGAALTAVPLKTGRLGAAPVRAFAKIPG